MDIASTHRVNVYKAGTLEIVHMSVHTQLVHMEPVHMEPVHMLEKTFQFLRQYTYYKLVHMESEHTEPVYIEPVHMNNWC